MLDDAAGTLVVRTRGTLVLVVALVLGLSSAALACEDGTFSIFGCDASHGRKFIELCGPSPLDAASGFLVYRFGSTKDEKDVVELSYPAERPGSLDRFYAATYTHHGVYTQSVRFVSGHFSYTVFTKAKGMEELGHQFLGFPAGQAAYDHCRGPAALGFGCGNRDARPVPRFRCDRRGRSVPACLRRAGRITGEPNAVGRCVVRIGSVPVARRRGIA